MSSITDIAKSIKVATQVKPARTTGPVTVYLDRVKFDEFKKKAEVNGTTASKLLLTFISEYLK